MKDREHVWVQPIAVDKNGTHESSVALSARASVDAFLTSMTLEQWGSWLAGPFTKTVRRASWGQLDALAASARGSGAGYSDLSSGGSRVVATSPCVYGELPREAARLQVAGTDLPRSGVPAGARRGPVRLVVDEALTTGKAGAQAAHALWMWVLARIEDDPEYIGEWQRTGLGIELEFAPARAIAAVAAVAGPGVWVVRDAGRTEVAPGSVTAYASATISSGR